MKKGRKKKRKRKERKDESGDVGGKVGVGGDVGRKGVVALMNTVRSSVHCTSISWRILRSKRCTALNGSFHSLLLGSFLSIYHGRIPLRLFNEKSESSLMSCTYPPTIKPSKQSTHSTSKPITQNSLKRSPLFFISNSSPSLCLGHRCHHYGSLHSRVSCV